MDISSRQAGSANVVTIVGDITLYNSRQVRSALLDAVQGAAGKQVIVNLQAVRYIDSSGVASLIEGLKASRDTGAKLTLVGLSRTAREVLELTRVLRLFDVQESEEKALGAGT